MKLSPIDLSPEYASPIEAERAIPRVGGRAGVDIKAASSGGVVISVFGSIGGDVTTASFKQALSSAAGRPVTIEVDSGGGDPFTGIAIFNLLAGYAGTVTAKVLSLAASAASVIVMGADEVQIAESAFLMIHRCWALVIGNTNDFLEQAAVFASIDDALARTYASRTGRPIDEMLSLMDDETWMLGETAIAQGFADKLLSSPPANAAAAGKFDLSTYRYRNIPTGLSSPAPRAEIKSRADIEKILVNAGVRRRAAQIVAEDGFAALSGEPTRQAKEWQQLVARIDAAAAEIRSAK
jgi:ATP-dependent Clp protease protease subunit